MTGLENIIGKIQSDANEKCAAIINEAKKEAAARTEKAKAEAQKEYEKIVNAGREKADRLIELSNKRIAQSEKSELLKAKVEAIDSVIASAGEVLASLPAERYFGVLLKLLKDHCISGEGLIFLNSDDLARLPEDFEKNAAECGAENGAELSVSDKGVPIKNGFLLKYGDIEINCTFDALIEEKRDELKEIVNSILFQG